MNTHFDFSTLNALDWGLIAVIGGSTLAGLRSGFTRVVIGLIAGIAGLVLGAWFYETPAKWLTPYIDSASFRNALGFVAVFLGVALFGSLVSRLAASVFKWAGLSWMDRILGGAAGLIRGLGIVVGMVTPMMAFSKPLPHFVEDSVLLPYALNISHVAVAVAPKELRDEFAVQSDRLKKIWADNMKNLPAKPKLGNPEDPEQKQPVPPKKESY